MKDFNVFKMMKTELDFSIKCRACCSEEQEMHHLYREFDQGLTLSDILRTTTSFEVEEDDGFSCYLCEKCTAVIVDFYNFKTIYKENEKYIRSLLDANNLKSIILIKVDTSEDPSDSKGTRDIKIETKIKAEGGNRTVPNIIVDGKTKTEIQENINTGVDKYSSLKTNFDKSKGLEITADFIEPEEVLGHNLSLNKIANFSEDKTENVHTITSIKYPCEVCGDSFVSTSEFQQHMLQKHEVSICESDKDIPEPAVAVPKLAKLETNYKTITFQCDVCKEEYQTWSEIKSHYKLHKKYICEQCGAAFLRKSYLDDHFEGHTSEKRHICPMCGKAFRRRTVLVKHKKLHTHPRQCVCEICGLRFNDKGTLKTHIKLKHIKERNYHCTICGLWFPLKSTLEKHIFRHKENRDREFICPICSMAYRDKSSLNRHVIVKHTENARKPSCKYCEKQYTTNTNLLKHIRKHHNSSEGKDNL